MSHLSDYYYYVVLNLASTLFHSWINLCFLTNSLSEWFDGSFIMTLTYLVPKQIEVFEWIIWVDDSLIHENGHMFLNKSFQPIVYSFI